MSTEVDKLKSRGNTALKEGKTDEAISLYTEAIELDPANHLLYSNRSAAYASLKKYKEALGDAEKTIELKPDWGKGYSRAGAALVYLERYKDAEEIYQKGLELEPSNEQLKKGLQECQDKRKAEHNPFSSREMLDKLRTNPKTASYMNDPSFVRGLQEIGQNQQALSKYMHDKRYIDALGVMLGVDLTTVTPNDDDDPMVQKPSPQSQKQEPSRAAKKKKEEPKAPEKMEVDEDDSTKKAAAEKEKGNAAYKKKDFVTALEHYDRAIELDPDNITLLTNKSAVYFEQGDFDQCLKTCELAVEKGRETRADYKLIAKAYTRMGNVYFKQEKWADAVKYYDKSLTEHRTQEVVNKKAQAQKCLKEEEKRAYIDVDKSLEEKQKGNELFQQGEFSRAIQHYNEAIRRNPDDAKIFSNRAACYHKLAEWPLALKDCDECIRLAPDFVKGHLRKGQALLGMKETAKAMAAFNKALELDPDNADAKDGLKKCYAQDDPETRRKHAMQDPQIQQIMSDPAMQIILRQMQDNPGAINDHLKNPEIAAKIEKLMEAGIISIRHA